jgi:hypothetical protein
MAALTDAVPGRAVQGLTSPGRLAPSAPATVTAGLAAGTGTAPAPSSAPAGGPPAGSPAGSGTAPPPAAQAAFTVTAGAPAGSGTAPRPSLAVQVLAGAAQGTGTAPEPSAATAVSGTGHAGQAAGTGQAPAPAGQPASSQHPGCPAGTGTAPAPSIATAAAGSGQPGPAAGTGQASPPAATAASRPAPPAPAGTGTAPQPAAAGVTAVTVTAGLAAGAGFAQPPALYTGQARAGLAAGTGTAPQPAVLAYSEVAGLLTDSLVIGGAIELLGGGVASTLPQCAGAIFRLGRGYDLGSPQPVVDLLTTLMGDGSRPTGWRYDNRTVTLPVTIVVPSTGDLPGDRLTLAGARELLLEVIAADEFTLTWAPDGQNNQLNLVWDCFRAHAATVIHDVLMARQLVSELTITFDALPYGRSDTAVALAFDSPVVGQAPPLGPVTIDDYTTVASLTQGTAGGTSYDTAAASPAPAAWWRLEDTAGSATAADSSGGGHAGTATNVTFGTASGGNAPAATAASFNGTSSRITSTYNPSGGGAWTVQAWVNLQGSVPRGNPRIISNSHTDVAGDRKGFELLLANGRWPQVWFGNGVSSAGAKAPAPIPLSGWVYLVGTWDGATIRLYVQNTLAATAFLNGTLAAGAANTAIGYNPTNSLDWMDGLVSEAAVTAATLTTGQIAANYQAGQPWWSQATVTALYSTSAQWHHDVAGAYQPLQYTRTLPAQVNLTGYGKILFWLGLAQDTTEYWRPKTPVTVLLILTDALGQTLKFSTRTPSYASKNTAWPVWNQITLTIPQGRAFAYDQVVSYQITAYNEVHQGGALELDAAGFLSGLTAAVIASPKRPASIRGGTYVLYDVEGSAPAPLNVHCQLGLVTQTPSTQVITLPGTPGTVSQYTAPPENPSWLLGDSNDFEGGTTGGWVGVSDGAAANATIAASTTQVLSGTYSMSMTPVSGGSSMTAAASTIANVGSQGVPASAGDRIAVRAWMRAGTTGRNVTVGAEFFNASGTSLGTVSLGAIADNNSSWTKIDGRVTAPANSANARLVVTVATPAAGEIHYLDAPYLAYAIQAQVVTRAAGGGGGSVVYKAGGGGGGAGEIAWETNLDLTPAANHAYSIGAGGQKGADPTNGAPGGDSYFTGTTTTVRAHGGGAGLGRKTANGNGAGGSGGSGSTNGHHFSGGSGSAGDYTQDEGGGGGGSPGDGGSGGNAGSGGQHVPGAAGAAGALGLPGAPGGGGYGGLAVGAAYKSGDGTRGNTPGAGGGGAGSSAALRGGGFGGSGTIRLQITTYSSSPAFGALVVHRPSTRTPILAKPVLDIGGGGDPPDGREYTIAQVDGQNARYAGTYTVILANFSWDGTAARTVTATIRQYTSGGAASAAATLTATVTPAQVTNGLVVLGEVTLPVTDMAADNTDAFFTVAVTSSDTLDRFTDLLLLDSQGVTFVVNLPSGGFSDYWVDAPDANADFGRVLGSLTDRSAAVSVLGSTFASGGPLRVDPGDNLLTVFSPAGMPALEASYFPRWWHERLA